MRRHGIEACILGSFAVSLSCGMGSALGCGSSPDDPGVRDSSITVSDASVGEDRAVLAAIDAAMDVDGGSLPVDPDAGSGTDPRFEVEMTYTTANIGRAYDTRAQVAAVFDHIGDVIGARSGPQLIGWQEIGEGDPCGGSCEIEELRDRFATERGWATRRPEGTRPDGSSEVVKVPVTSRDASEISARAVFASPGWTGVSPTRFVTVMDYAERNLSVLNTHFIAGAWSCESDVTRRREYWHRAWNTLRDQVAIEHDRGRNVVVTGDLNRPRAANSCNPEWDPTSLHPEARVVGGAGIDYIFVVPATAWSFILARRADAAVDRGSIRLGIDGHEAHWVAGRFERP